MEAKVTYKVLQRHIWSEAVLTETSFDYADGVCFDALLEFIEDNADSIYEFDESFTEKEISVNRLVASCPYCEAGKNQVLRKDGWLEAQSWRYADFPTPLWINEDECLQALESSDIHELGCLEVILDIPLLESQGTMAFGLDLTQVIDDLRRGYKPRMDYEWRAKQPLRNGFLCGRYRCPHCGEVFAVAYRRRGYIDIPLLVDTALTSLLEASAELSPRMGASLEDASIDGLVTMLSLEAQRDDEGLELTTETPSRIGSLYFDFKRGTTEFDGRSFIKDNRFVFDKFHDNPRSKLWYRLFEYREVVVPLSIVLPRLPETVELLYGSGEIKSYLEESRNLLLFMAANRFLGYPASFFNELVPEGRSYGCDMFEMAFPVGFALPRKFAYLPSCYEGLGLPDDEAIKRAICNNPMLLLELLACGMNYIFENTAVLRKLFQSPRSASYIWFMNQNLYSGASWKKLAKAKGEEEIFRFIETLEDDEISNLSARLGMGKLGEMTITDFAKLDLGDLVRKP